MSRTAQQISNDLTMKELTRLRLIGQSRHVPSGCFEHQFKIIKVPPNEFFRWIKIHTKGKFAYAQIWISFELASDAMLVKLQYWGTLVDKMDV